jgi:hypothetical protein
MNCTNILLTLSASFLHFFLISPVLSLFTSSKMDLEVPSKNRVEAPREEKTRGTLLELGYSIDSEPKG